jgi:hypothetical protein
LVQPGAAETRCSAAAQRHPGAWRRRSGTELVRGDEEAVGRWRVKKNERLETSVVVGKHAPSLNSARVSRRTKSSARDSALAEEKNLFPRRFGASAGGARETLRAQFGS